jgi:DNA-binding HxlR family transcriptional regulator
VAAGAASEALGLIAKSATPDSQATRYRLTERGDSLRVVFTGIYQWGDRHAAAYGVKCDNPVRAARKLGFGKK